MTIPADWQSRRDLPRLSGIGIARALSLGPESGSPGAGLIAGEVRSAGPALLPESFVASLGKPPPRPDVVRLGGFQAYRYTGVSSGALQRSFSLDVTPGTRGVAVVACFAPQPARRFLADCERVASTLERLGGRSLPVGPQAGYGRALGRILDRLERSRSAQRRSLGRARSRRGQALASAALMKAHGVAATSLAAAPAGPIERPSASRTVTALQRVSRGYRGLLASVRRNDGRGFANARRMVRRSEVRLDAELTGSP